MPKLANTSASCSSPVSGRLAAPLRHAVRGNESLRPTAALLSGRLLSAKSGHRHPGSLPGKHARGTIVPGGRPQESRQRPNPDDLAGDSRCVAPIVRERGHSLGQ